jgi:hypothetical protein
MPFGLSSCNWIPVADFLGAEEGEKEDEGTRRAVVEVERREGEGASHELWRPGADPNS